MNKEEIKKILKKKSNIYQRQRYRGTAYNDDDYEAFHILIYIEILEQQLDIANKKLDKIKELVNKYGYYTLSEIPELLSIIDGE